MIEMVLTSLQIVYTIISLIGCYLIVKKKRAGWLMWIAAGPFNIAIFIMKDIYILIFPFTVFMGFYVWGWWNWKDAN